MKSRNFALLACTLNFFLFGVQTNAFSGADEAEFSSASRTTPPEPHSGCDLLRRARCVNEQFHNGLRSFVCDEKVVRSHSALDGSRLQRMDTVTARVSFENGTEQYSDVRSNNRPRTSLSNLRGAWSEGEFGTLLYQTQQLLQSQRITIGGFTDFDGVPAARYMFEVAQQESPWTLIVEAKSYRIPFRTVVWVDRSSGQILQVNRTSTSMPHEVHISGLEWSVRLRMVNVSGSKSLLPVSGEYSVFYDAEDRREWNQLSFSNYRRYGAEVALRFDAAEPATPAAPNSSAASPSRQER